jgi:hypothetical protein
MAAVGPAHGQVTDVKIENGDVYTQSGSGVVRLTNDGDNIEATVSRDGNLVAYVHQGPEIDSSTLNDIYLCSVPQKSCVRAVTGREGIATTEDNLAEIHNVRFSLQAAQQPDTTLRGSLFFLSEAGGANTDALHRLPFGNKTLSQLANSAAPFVTYADTLEIVPDGKYAGALKIVQQTLTPGRVVGCWHNVIFDPNTKKVLKDEGVEDC